MNQHCPHCNALLFRRAGLDDQAFGEAIAEPAVYQVGGEHYADCGKCGQPVRMEPASAETGLAYVVSHNRK